MVGGVCGRKRGDVHGRKNGNCSGQYASYWNAFFVFCCAHPGPDPGPVNKP